MRPFTFKNITPYLILIITISSINQWSRFTIGNTVFWWLVYSFILISFFKGYKQTVTQLTNGIWVIKLFLGVVLCSFLYGMCIAKYYWDWKLLIGNLIVFLLPLAVYNFHSPASIQKTIRIWLKYAVLFFPVFLFFVLPESYGRYLIPISFLSLFFPKLPFKTKILVVVTILLILLCSLDSRSNVIRFTIPFIFSFLSFFYFIFSRRFMNSVLLGMAFLFLIAPFVLFGLAATGKFNVLNFKEYLTEWYDEVQVVDGVHGNEDSFFADTRTFLYEEEIASALKNNYWLFGHSMARGYETIAFADADKEIMSETKRQERKSCEVSILNVFNYFGVVGVLVYFLIFTCAAYIAIKKSRNKYIKIVGVYVAFRWMFGWVEDYSQFDLNYLFLWIMIAMCFSIPFRQMSNNEFVSWLHYMLSRKKCFSYAKNSSIINCTQP